MIRLIVDEPLSGTRNMSIDQALLTSAAESGISTLRIYRWQPATVSLGYFQTWDSRSTHTASRDCPVVRRASGGGAIVHDHEMTYSLALPAGDRWASENRGLFDTVHRSLIECLKELGVRGCTVYQEPKAASRSAPFLCFRRRSQGDVVLGEHKIIGSAQRRLHKALLQHGSVLVERSKFAPELPGIRDICSHCNCSVESLIAAWPTYLARSLNWTLEAGRLTKSELESAKSIEADQFNNPAWNRKR